MHNKKLFRVVSYNILFALTVIVILAAFVFIKPSIVFSQSSTPITGWVWSDAIGWISLNCSDRSTCGTVNYGISKAADGTLSGYAWSDTIGWISANVADTAGCPSAPCTARLSGSALSGWMKALAASNAQSGGWDGFVSLAGSGYGVTSGSGSLLQGYSWGSLNIGWASFSAAYACSATAGYYCNGNTQMHRDAACNISTIQVCSYQCAADIGACVSAPSTSGTLTGGAAITASPRLVPAGNKVRISWGTQNASSCTVAENNPAISDSWSGTSGAATSSVISAPTTYTLSCTGTDSAAFSQSVTVVVVPSWTEF